MRFLADFRGRGAHPAISAHSPRRDKYHHRTCDRHALRNSGKPPLLIFRLAGPLHPSAARSLVLLQARAPGNVLVLLSMTRPPQSWQPQSLLKSAPPHGSAGDEEAALNAPAMRTQSSQAASCWPLRLCVTPRLPRGSTCSSGSTIMCYVPAISEQIFEKPSAGGIGWPDSPSQMPQTPLGTSSLSEDMAEAGERKGASRTKTARAEQTSGFAWSACDVSAARLARDHTLRSRP